MPFTYQGAQIRTVEIDVLHRRCRDLQPVALANRPTPKDLQNRYLLDVVQAPRGINETSEDEDLWGRSAVMAWP